MRSFGGASGDGIPLVSQPVIQQDTQYVGLRRPSAKEASLCAEWRSKKRRRCGPCLPRMLAASPFGRYTRFANNAEAWRGTGAVAATVNYIEQQAALLYAPLVQAMAPTLAVIAEQQLAGAKCAAK